jgi:hypothetical protein
MSKKHVYSKDATGFGDFIYIDLLPEVRRSRQFNVNVIISLLFAIVLAFFLIYRPYSDATFLLEDVSSINYDLEHEFALTQEEFNGYEIDIEAISFEEDIHEMEKLRVNFNNLIDDIELIVDANSGRIKEITYNAETKEIRVTVAIVSQFSYNTLNNNLLSLEWVSSSIYGVPVRQPDQVEYTSIFVIGVDYNVE